MSTPLREFIVSRKAELRRQIDAAQAELSELDQAEKAIGTVHEASVALGLVTEVDTAGRIGALKGTISLPRFTARGTLRKATIQTMIVDVLRDFPGGLEALEIVRHIRERYGRDVPRTSLSPQLSRLKTDGVIDLENKTWRLTESNSASETTPGA